MIWCDMSAVDWDGLGSKYLENNVMQSFKLTVVHLPVNTQLPIKLR